MLDIEDGGITPLRNVRKYAEPINRAPERREIRAPLGKANMARRRECSLVDDGKRGGRPVMNVT